MTLDRFRRIGVMGVYELPLELIGLGRRGDHDDRMPRILAMVATLEAGRPLPPVIVHETPSGYFYCDDGYHRLWAYTLAGRRFAAALVTTMLDPAEVARRNPKHQMKPHDPALFERIAGPRHVWTRVRPSGEAEQIAEARGAATYEARDPERGSVIRCSLVDLVPPPQATPAS